MKWLIYTRGTIPIQRIVLFMYGFKIFKSTKKAYNYFEILFSTEGEKVWFAWDKKKAEAYGKILNKICTNKKQFVEHYQESKKECKKAIKYSEKIEKKDLSKLSDIQLEKLYWEMLNTVVESNVWLGINVDIFDIAYDDYFFKEFKKEFKNKEEAEVRNIYQEISTPACVTYLHKEEVAILRLALKNKILKKDIEIIYNNFWWTSLGWESLKTKSYKYFENKINKLSKDKNSKEKLKRLNNHIANILNRRNELIKKHKLSNKIKHLLDVADKYTELHDARKEMQVKNVHTIYFLLKEISKRKKVPVKDLEWYWPDEISNLFKNIKLNKETLKTRYKCTCSIVNKKLFKVYYGQEGINLRKKELKIENNNLDTVKGQTANKGIVRGIARICNGAEDALKKIKKGDILITGMTLPDYVPAMKKAGAIITDEGGITCHAAIVSRELDIPCIIGTKVATHFIKDGDKLLVDAGKGIIKIIK